MSRAKKVEEETYESENTPMMWGYGFNWLNMTLMMFASILGLVLLVVLVWVVIRWLNKRMPSPTGQTNTLSDSGPTAREIVSQRYARGEIDATTFEQMRERLEGSDSVYRRKPDEVRMPAGESLFDGSTRG